MHSFVNPLGKACCDLLLTGVWADGHLRWQQSPSDPPLLPHLKYHQRTNTDENSPPDSSLLTYKQVVGLFWEHKMVPGFSDAHS